MTRELAQIIDKETGDVNELRDKKLADATSQSVINTNDAIEMKTTTGEQVFITKDSFMQAIGQAFSASDPKTFTKLLGMNNGSPMGIGASDLALVLGVPYFISRVRTTLAQGEYTDITLYYGGVLFVTAITPGGVVNSAGVSLGYQGGVGVVVPIYKYGDTLGINDASKPCNITLPNPYTFRITSVSGTTSIGYIGMQVWQ